MRLSVRVPITKGVLDRDLRFRFFFNIVPSYKNMIITVKIFHFQLAFMPPLEELIPNLILAPKEHARFFTLGRQKLAYTKYGWHWIVRSYQTGN